MEFVTIFATTAKDYKLYQHLPPFPYSTPPIHLCCLSPLHTTSGKDNLTNDDKAVLK